MTAREAANWSAQDVQLARDARVLEQMLSHPQLAELYAELDRWWPS